MKAQWSKWAEARLLPFPGEAWTVEIKLKKSEATIAKVAGKVPESPTVAAEVARAIKARVNEHYDEKGNHPRDTLGRDLVDVWCARKGVAFATEVLVEMCKAPQLPRESRPGPPPPYEVRRDGQPWGRLREHLAASTEAERDNAKKIASAARTAKSHVRIGVAYAFCVDSWVAEAIDGAIKRGYGELALIGALADAEQARAALLRLLDGGLPKYQLVEESVVHVPNLMQKLADSDAPLVVRAAGQAWNASVRKPWLEVVASLRSPEAAAFLAEHAKK